MRLAVLLSSLLLIAACRSRSLDTPDNDLASTTASDLADCGEWTDEQSCVAHGCLSFQCPDICGPQQYVCYAPGAPQPSCEPPPCVADCSTFTTQAACEAAAPCYTLFTQAPCGCAAIDCCSMAFASCTNGPILCAAANFATCPPAPACNTDYAPVFGADGCQIGCLEQSVEQMLCGA
jgi:hypothetical protein